MTRRWHLRENYSRSRLQAREACVVPTLGVLTLVRRSRDDLYPRRLFPLSVVIPHSTLEVKSGLMTQLERDNGFLFSMVYNWRLGKQILSTGVLTKFTLDYTFDSPALPELPYFVRKLNTRHLSTMQQG